MLFKKKKNNKVKDNRFVKNYGLQTIYMCVIV